MSKPYSRKLDRNPTFSSANKLVASRRQFLRLGGSLLGMLALSGLPSNVFGASKRLSRVAAYPFTLGVASGDPTSDSVILWTKIDPAALIGLGVDNDAIDVDYEVATDSNFTTIIRTGNIVAPPQLGYSAHLELRGLSPQTVYFYRWRLGGEISPVGRTKTAPLASASVQSFRFAVASCQQYEQGFFTAYDHMSKEDLDLIVHLGDYIYESSWGDVLVRRHEGPEIVTLNDYRARYTTYKSDADLQSAHASAPWAITWDDHEVDNNYASDIAEDDQTPDQLLARRAAAYQAFYEFTPIRLPVGRQGPDMPIYRRLRIGNLLEMSVLDTRQYRSDQACGDGRKRSCSAHMDSSRTLLGDAQKKWLFDSLASTDAVWNVLAQQIMMASLTSKDEQGETLWPMDIWDGYPFERDELLNHIHDRKTPNPIVLTGDIHSNWVADLKLNFEDARSKIVGTEFVGTSITSGGDGSDMTTYGETLLANNPHVKHYNGQRGYMVATVNDKNWQNDFRIVDKVTVRGAPIRTQASFVVEAGEAGAKRM